MHCNATQWAKVEESRAVDLHWAFAIFTGPRPDVVKIVRQAQLFNACSTECAFRQCSWFISTIHIEGESCKREATLESIFTKLCAWCQDAAVLCFVTDPNAA